VPDAEVRSCAGKLEGLPKNGAHTAPHTSRLRDLSPIDHIALLYFALPLWRSMSDSVGGLAVARRLQKLFHDLSRLSTDHGDWE